MLFPYRTTSGPYLEAGTMAVKVIHIEALLCLGQFCISPLLHLTHIISCLCMIKDHDLDRVHILHRYRPMEVSSKAGNPEIIGMHQIERLPSAPNTLTHLWSSLKLPSTPNSASFPTQSEVSSTSLHIQSSISSSTWTHSGLPTVID